MDDGHNREVSVHQKIGQLIGEVDWFKQTESLSLDEKRRLIDPRDSQLSISRQCKRLTLNRSSYYYGPATETEANLTLMRLIDEEYTRHPVYGRRRMTAYLKRLGHQVNSKRIRRN